MAKDTVTTAAPVTKPKAGKRANVAIELPPEAPAIVPEGIVLPPVVEHNLAEVESKAATVLADEVKNAAPLAVPAVDPHAPDAELLATLTGAINADWIKFWGSRPIVSDAPEYNAPDEDAIDERAMAYKLAQAALNVKVSLGNAIDHVRSEIAVESAAALIARMSQTPVDDAHLKAGIGVLENLAATLRAQVKGKIAKTKVAATATEGVKKERAVTGTAAEKAQKLIAYCASKGLEHVDLIDIYKNGYQDEFHCVRLLPDGRYEKLDYRKDTMTTTPTGEIITSWKYFVSKTDGKAPQYSRHQMYGILDPQQRLNRAGPSRAAWAKHLADMELVINHDVK